MNDTSLRAQFFNDSLDLLADAEEYVLQLENEGFDKDTVHSLFRLFHTLKGNSNMVGEGEISSLTHALESQYDAVRTMKMELGGELLQSTFEVIDLLSMVCQEGESSGYKERLVELTHKFESPIKAGGGTSPGSGESSEAGGSTGRRGTKSTGSETAGADGGRDASSSEAAAGILSGAERERLPDFDAWRAIMTAFYRLESYARRMADPHSDEDWEDTLMDLGMAAIDLRSAVDSASEYLDRITVYLEKFTSTLSREQIPYSEISYELLFTLLGDFRRGMWERLYLLGVFRHYRIDSPEALDEVVGRLEDKQVLYVVELAIKQDTFLREAAIFAKLEKVTAAAPGRVVLISPRMQLMQKATALLDQALEGFPQIAMDIEEGVRTLLMTEE